MPDTKFEFEVPKAGATGKMRTVARNILATENQQAIINNVIEVKISVYLHKT